MSIWRLQLRSRIVKDHNDCVRFCIAQQVVGTGWGIDSDPITPEEYFQLARDQHDNFSNKVMKWFIHTIENNDLVWFRDTTGDYYIARITGDWQHRIDEQARAVDVVNVRTAEIYNVGHQVAGGIINSFSIGATVQVIGNTLTRPMLTAYSQMVFNSHRAEPFYNIQIDVQDYYALFTATDLEDLVGLYLQVVRGYYLLPSSRSRTNNTIDYEYELISPQGTSYLVQVKTGMILNPQTYIDRNRNYILFSPAGYIAHGGERDNVECLSRDTLDTFIRDSFHLLPQPIQHWIQYFDAV